MRFIYFIPVFYMVLFPSFAESSKKITLSEAYLSAFKKTEILLLEESRRYQADARVNQASSTFLPSVSAKANYLMQRGNSVSGDGSIFSFSVIQYLYQGGRNYALLKAAKSDKISKEYSFTAARVDTFSQVADSYYKILSAKLDIKNLNTALNLTKGIIEELKKRNAIGQTKNSEVLMAEAELSVDQADLKAAEGRLNAAKEQFAFITGLDTKTEITDDTKTQPLINQLEYYLNFADKRPDILFLKADLTTAKENLKKEKLGHMPSVYLEADWNPLTSGNSNSPDWDLGIGMSIPIFDGYNIEAKIKEAIGKVDEAEAILNKQKRQAQSDIKSAYENVVNLKDQINALVSALSATEKNYIEQKKDYTLSLVTNLDVLQALNSFQTTKRNLDKTRALMKASFAQLLAEVAQIPE